jgi:hypothetical protein
MKAIKQAELNDILHKHFTDEISASKVVEYLNDLADDFAIGFTNWCIKNYHLEGLFTGILDEKQLLEIYKKENNL